MQQEPRQKRQGLQNFRQTALMQPGLKDKRLKQKELKPRNLNQPAF